MKTAYIKPEIEKEYVLPESEFMNQDSTGDEYGESGLGNSSTFDADEDVSGGQSNIWED